MKIIKKTNGVTLVEVIIALAILSMATSAIYLMFSSSQRTMVDTELKSKLQYEAQVIQERLSTIGAQAQGIINIQLESEGSKTPEILEIKSYKNDKNDSNNDDDFAEYKFTFENNKLSLDGKVLSENVEDFTIETIDKKPYGETKAVKIHITLRGEKGYSKEKYDVSTTINFRNK